MAREPIPMSVEVRYFTFRLIGFLGLLTGTLVHSWWLVAIVFLVFLINSGRGLWREFHSTGCSMIEDPVHMMIDGVVKDDYPYFCQKHEFRTDRYEIAFDHVWANLEERV